MKEQEEEDQNNNNKIPIKYFIESKVVQIIFFIQGISIFLPFFSFINSPDYFLSLFSGDIEIVSIIQSVYCFSSLLGFFLSILISLLTIQTTRSTTRSINLLTNFCPPNFLTNFCFLLFCIQIPYLVVIFCLFLISSLNWWNFLDDQNWAMFSILLTLFFCCGFLMSLLFGEIIKQSFIIMMRRRSGSVVENIMFGSSFSGVLISLIRIIIKISTENRKSKNSSSNTISNTLYFSLNAIILLTFFCVYHFVIIIPFGREKVFLNSENSLKKTSSIITTSSAALITGFEGGELTKEDQTFLKQSVPFHIVVYKEIRDWSESFYYNWNGFLHLFVLYLVSYSVFPGICVTSPTSFPLSFMKNGNWLAIIMTASFCSFEFIGRIVAKLVVFRSTRRQGRIVTLGCLLTISRVIFVVPIILSVHPLWWLHHDVIPIAFIAILGVTNGYLAESYVKQTAKREEKNSRKRAKKRNLYGEEVEKFVQKCQKIVGTLSVFSILLGMAVGSWLSLALNYVIKAITMKG